MYHTVFKKTEHFGGRMHGRKNSIYSRDFVVNIFSGIIGVDNYIDEQL